MDAGESIGAEVLVADGVIVLVAVVRSVAGVVLRLAVVLLVAALLTKHLVKEAAKLGVGKAQEGEDGDEVS